MATRTSLPRPVRFALDALTGVVGDRVLLSPWTLRLARISFLGALDHAPGCRERTSRLDHSAAVAELALRIGRSLELRDGELRLLVTAALLHDVGHLPLSHTAESAFRARLGVDHHEITRWIIEGGGAIPRERSLAPALEHAGLDPRGVWSLVDGGDAGPLAPLVSGTLSADTLDGIARAARAFGLRPSPLPAEPFALRDGGLVALPGAVAALDRFWSLKDRVYRRVINAPAHAALELRIAALAGRRLTEDALGDLAGFDDRALLAMLGLRERELAPDDAERASRFVAAGAPDAPVRVLREYSIDRGVEARDGLAARDWPRRWRTSKHRWHLVTQSPAVQMLLPASWETEGDLP